MKYLPLISVIALFSGTAYAADTPAPDGGFFFKPYVGADYQYTSVSYAAISGTPYNGDELFANSFNGGDVHIGARIHKYLGIEAGYFDTASSSKSNVLGTSASTSLRFSGENLDAMGYLPLGESKAELIGVVGVNHSSVNASATVSGTTYTDGGSRTFAEYGGGAEYWITDNLNARLLVRYEDVNDSSVSSIISTSLGLNYQFR